MSDFSGFNVGDIVEAAVNHPDNNKVIMAGMTGRVAKIGDTRSAILVDWDVEPNADYFHRGASGISCVLDHDTGWWIYKSSYVKIVTDQFAERPGEADFLALFA